MSTPFLITPKVLTLDDVTETVCCKLDGVRYTPALVARTDDPPEVENDPWVSLEGEPNGPGEFLVIRFYSCCGDSIKIRFTWSVPEAFAQYMILLNGAIIVQGLSDNQPVIEYELSMTSMPCGNLIDILTGTTDGTLTVEVVK
jgi:hypothetical protein